MKTVFFRDRNRHRFAMDKVDEIRIAGIVRIRNYHLVVFFKQSGKNQKNGR